jgi:hypothetical protein
MANLAIGFNFETGNSYLAGEDPCRWLARIAGHLVRLYAKVISIQHAHYDDLLARRTQEAAPNPPAPTGFCQ